MTLTIVDMPWLAEPAADIAERCARLVLADLHAGSEIQALAAARLNARQAGMLARAISRCRKAGVDLGPLLNFRLGVLASETFDIVQDSLPAAAARHGVALDLFTTPYDQVMQQALDPQAEIHRTPLDAVLIAVDHRWLKLHQPDLANAGSDAVQTSIERLRAVVEGLRLHSNAPAILQTLPAPSAAMFGSFDRCQQGTIRWQIDTANLAIVKLAIDTGSYLLDVAALAERIGTDRWFDPVRWFSYKMPFAAENAPIYADLLGRLLGAIRGRSRKCLVLDLDNTVWGGVIGDDGLSGIQVGQGSARGEAFLAVQQAAVHLRDRGVILAVCSKNDDATARSPFGEHPDMLLREEHITVFQANWVDKPSNLEAIASALNIGLDALVMLDDNPAERAQVRAALPMVAVPELPDDPSWFAWTLEAAGYFEATGFSTEDRLRAEFYARDTKRAEVMATSRNLGDYLSSLDMVIQFRPFDEPGRLRVTQLINKTNQFNLTTRRYTETEVAAIQADVSIFTMETRLSDRFGDLGMIGIVICRPSEQAGDWLIDSWLMSCRVLGRQVEQAMLATVANQAHGLGINRLLGRYRPTAKNGMVADLYARLGFMAAGGDDSGTAWVLDLDDYVPPSLPMTVDSQF